MTFKTQPHRYTIDLAPTSRAHCRGCRKLIEKGGLRLVTHAFVKPNRRTMLARHLNLECVGPAIAADVMRARGVGNGAVHVSGRVEPKVVARVWTQMEAHSSLGRA